MSKFAGALIKKKRLEMNLSQESLSKGICSISYLSKIESGKTDASEEVISLIYKRLFIAESVEASTLKSMFPLIDKALEELISGHMIQAEKTYSELLKFKEQLEDSEAVIDWMILRGYMATEAFDVDVLEETMTSIEALATYFSEIQRYHFNILKGNLLNFKHEYTASIDWFLKSMFINRSGAVLKNLGIAYFYTGDYMLAVEYGNEAYFMLMDQGNLKDGLIVSLFLAGAYSNMGQVDKAIAIYKRVENLTQKFEHVESIFNVNYNLGATYLSVENHELALDYLKKALSVATVVNDWQCALLYQKLALCYIGLKDMTSARTWIKTLREKMNLTGDASLKLSVEWLSHYLQTDDPVKNPAYLDAIQRTYNASKQDSHFGFHTMYGKYLVEAYKAQRRYKEALALYEELNIS